MRKFAGAGRCRVKLEGKNYLEQYVYALTHELKSPLAAIRGAAEMYAKVRRRKWWLVFQHSDAKCTMQALVETLLRQARLENRRKSF
ncbi:histidine kinase dimerization/phospho-acceptor domain-containing protein [Shigella sonnei]